MSDLIRRQDAIREIDDAEVEVWESSDADYNLGLDHAKVILEALPSADAVEVVRCKDCLMTKERDEYTGKVWCCRHREYMDYMYYCADGLRREDGEEE